MIAIQAYARLVAVCALMLCTVVARAAEPPAQAAYYPTPDAAVQALLNATADHDDAALAKVLGPNFAELRSGDPVADAADYDAFVEAADESARIEQEEGDEDHAVLTVGPDDWPFPIPLVRDAKGWCFDMAAGKEEVFNRRIGRNELYTIASLRAYVQAQDEYADEDRNGDGVLEYARRLMSTKGTRDGLYWPTVDGEPESPLGPGVARAVSEGYKPGVSGRSMPYHGYLFRELTAQGEHAPGGAKSYLKDGHLTGGFALLAYPATYGNSGIMSFQVNQSGIVYQRDLGPDTATAAAAITVYDPDEHWEAVTD